ncbi:MAG: adenine phosphoribosyltransferase [Gemmatimonadaceae bacterium]
MIDLRRYIRDVADFPLPGILFRDITPLLADALAFQCAVEAMCAYVASREVDVVVAIESRGFLFGAPIADRLGLPFVPVRKPGRLPAERVSVDVTLEYGRGALEVHADALRSAARAVVVDDLLATGGTAAGAAHLVELLGGTVVGAVFVVELAALGGRAALAPYEVHSLITYD